MNRVFTDWQSICNLYPFFEGRLENWANEMVLGIMRDFKEGKFPESLLDFDEEDVNEGILDTDKWMLRKALIHEVPLDIKWIRRRILSYFKTAFDSPRGLRVLVPHAIARYCTTDPGTHVSKGRIVVKGARIYFSTEDVGWLFPLMGGMDNDDRLVIIPIMNNKVLLYRSPNMIGEWVVMDIEASDYEFKHWYLPVNSPAKVTKSLSWFSSDLDAHKKMHNLLGTITGFKVPMCLSNRIQRKYRKAVEFTNDDSLTKTYESVRATIKEAIDMMKDHVDSISVPSEVYNRLAAGLMNNPMHEVAKDMRGEYGRSVGRALGSKESAIAKLNSDFMVAVKNADGYDKLSLENTLYKDMQAVDDALNIKIEKASGHVRGVLNKYSEKERLWIIEDLMRMCYVTSTSHTSEIHDGILGIGDSRVKRGTATVMIDWLVLNGFGCMLLTREEAGDLLDENDSKFNGLTNEMVKVVRNSYNWVPSTRTVTVSGWEKSNQKLKGDKINAFAQYLSMCKEIIVDNSGKLFVGNIHVGYKPKSLIPGTYTIARILTKKPSENMIIEIEINI